MQTFLHSAKERYDENVNKALSRADIEKACCKTVFLCAFSRICGIVCANLNWSSGMQQPKK
jgi:hypothetical protein